MGKNKGITLIALIVTIIVMLILVAITLQITLGENGIIVKTKEAREQNEKADKQEEVNLAIAALIVANKGNIDDIKPEHIADKLNETKSRYIFAADINFPTEIIYPATATSIKKEIRVPVNLDLTVGTTEVVTHEEALKRIYNYEIIDNNAKTARIKSIKEGCKEYTEHNYKLKYGTEEITELTLPDTVKINEVEYTITNIGDNLFFGCNNITSIEIPNSITSIGNSAFHDCSSLDNIEIPNSVTSIGTEAFYNCSSLDNIEIPSSVTSIGFQAFGWCLKLTNINVNTANSNYSSDDGVLFNKGKTTLVCYPADKVETQYSIPSSVASIESHAFLNCTYLTRITIPGSITEIKTNGFYRCTKLINITVDIANSYYSSDENGILFNKGKSTLVCYPAGKIETTYEIPNTVGTIGTSAFVACTYLKNIIIPSSVTGIEGGVFFFSSKLENINVDGTNNNYSSDGGILFNKGKSTLVCYPAGKVEIQYSIPSSVTNIENGAFQYCTELNNITIPNSVENIGVSAFDNCTSLSSIIIPSSVEGIGNSAFSNCTGLTNINISQPKNSISGSPWGAYGATITWNY